MDRFLETYIPPKSNKEEIGNLNRSITRNEIEYAIKDAYNNPRTHQEWVGIFGEGNLPTPEEFLCIMTEAIKK